MDATLGTFFELGGRGAMEALGNTGLDYVIIDTEHGCFSDETVADLVVAAENCKLEPYVRIGSVQRPHVLRALDVGARGLIVPNIRSMEEIEELVRNAKFPPLGKRGFCPNRTSGWGTQAWASNALNYMEEANRRVKILPQCETKEALEQIEEIAAHPGIDGIFVGPFDLSVDMGIPLQLDHPDLVAAIQRILKACQTAGKESYIFAGTLDGAIQWAKRGFSSVTYNLDASMLIGAYQDAIVQFRAE